MNILRQLIADDGDRDDNDGTGSPPPQAAVVNGNDPAPSADLAAPEPARRKRHLGLYIGGAAAALAAISGAAREAASGHRAQLVGAVTGAAVTAATVTVVTVQPFHQDSGYEAPYADPLPATSPPTYVPPGSRPSKPPGSTAPSPTAPPTVSPTGPSVSPSPSATGPTLSGRASQPPVSAVPAGGKAPAADASLAGPDSGAEDDTGGNADEPPPAAGASPGPSPGPTQPPPDPVDDPPPAAEESADSGLCVDLAARPPVETQTCALG
ncbi:hypothetical protein [Streptomyces sp. NPDC029519]|uniref:hypothetical protein n=1 Tax=Streptomyces sp. NPDC029519 TaxID=3155364 RepID=UPI0033CEB6A9